MNIARDIRTIIVRLVDRQGDAKSARPNAPFVRRTKGEYATLVAVAIRECQVSFSDSRGVHHAVAVQASTVLEAAGLGLKRIREQEMLDSDEGFGDIKVEVRTTTVHTVPISKLREWRDSNGATPREMSRKANTR
jgi:hypothetical protein